MKEKQVWDIVRDLWEKYDCKNIISTETLRRTIIDVTGVVDVGTTSRSLNSLLDYDIIRADYGKFVYGSQGKRLLKKFGFIDDDRIDIKPEFETVDSIKKMKSEVVVHHHADLPDLPAEHLDEYQKLKDKTKKDVPNENP